MCFHDKGTEEVITMKEKVEEENGAIWMDGRREGLADFAKGNSWWLVLSGISHALFNVYFPIPIMFGIDLWLTFKRRGAYLNVNNFSKVSFFLYCSNPLKFRF